VVLVDEKPCCEAEALRRIRQVKVGDIVVGISMLDHILAEVREMELPDEKEIGRELLKRVKIYNYIPASAEEKYRMALLEEYLKCKGGGTI
jgi:ribosomal protein L13